jgi:isoquinoline 1-oxidoreductase beta subunit
VPGILAIFREPDWVGAVATNWWAANRAVEAMRPVFTGGSAASSVRIDASLAGALAGGGSNIFRSGDAAAPLAAPDAVHSDYQVGLAPSAPLEPLTATARFTGDRLEIWAPTQAPGLARAAAARAADISESAVTIYQTLAGGGYGRKLETKAIEQAALIAKAMRRPVQLSWPRVEETVQDGFRPPAQGRLSARLAAPGGAILAWRAVIAAPDAVGDAIARLRGKAPGAPRAAGSAVEGAVPPYAIPAVAVAHAPVALPIRTGIWRSGAHSYTAFFTECFVDELARRARLEPLSFRMQMLGDNPRLARCLTSAAMLGGWDGGGPGSAMGIAAHSAFGSHVATLVEIAMGGDQRVRVLRAVSAVDCGRIVNPNIVRQQIEGGIVHGISSATGAPILFERGVPNVARLADLRLPTLADCPEISVELIESQEAPGGVTELGVPTVAPAIANALFAMTGQRLRSLPLGSGR